MKKTTHKILIVENEQLVRWSLFQALSKAGFDAVAVNSGERAIENINTSAFDLVITDFDLPTISGLEVASSVKNNSPAIPVILTSAFSENELNIKNYKNYFDFVIEKPYDLNELTELIFLLLSVKKSNE